MEIMPKKQNPSYTKYRATDTFVHCELPTVRDHQPANIKLCLAQGFCLPVAVLALMQFE